MENRDPAHAGLPVVSAWPVGDGEMGALIRAYDWAQTPLGAAEGWLPSLRTAVETVLACGFPMIVLWGADLIQLYNDGYRALMGVKHPAGLGQPTRACWPEVWPITEPIYARVWAGATLTFADALYPITRHGDLEDAWFTLCYSPLRDESGAIAGILVTAIETTEHVLSVRERDAAEAALRAANATLEQRVAARTEDLAATLAQLRDSEERFRTLVQASSEVLYVMSPDWEEMRALSGGGFLADTPNPSPTWLAQYIHPDDHAEVLAAIAEAVHTKSVFALEHRVRRLDGSLGWTLSRAVPRLDPQGAVVEWFGAASDVTARREAVEALRAALAAQQALLREVNHRVKNNLAVITSLLSLQAADLADESARQALGAAAQRVRAMGVVHRLLYDAPHLAPVEVGRFAGALARALGASYGAAERIAVAVSGDAFGVDLERAVPVGLILNELLTNALKYAFPDGRRGTIRLQIDAASGVLELADDGVGLPPAVDVERPRTLGLQLVQALVRQVRGTLTVVSGPGTRYRLQLPVLLLRPP